MILSIRLRRREYVAACVAFSLASAAACPAAPVILGRLGGLDSADPGLRSRSADSVLTANLPGTAGLLSGAIDPREYVVGPGDVFSLEKGSPAGTQQTLVVDAEGSLYVPDLGRRGVAGQRLADVRSRVLSDLRRFVPRAELELRLLRPRVFKVFVVGETTNPGTVAATATNRAVEALQERGGLTKTASIRNIELRRSSGATDRVDMQRFLVLGDNAHNPWLQDGDRIVIPRLRGQVYLAGAIERPGYVESAPGDSLATLVRLAGGLSDGAREDSVLVLGFHEGDAADSTWLPVAAAMASPMRPDDRVFIRRRTHWRPLDLVTVEGEVTLPGEYPIREGHDRLSDAVSWVGGFTPEASLRNVVLTRDADAALFGDPDLERLRRLTRAEMTETEYFDLKMRTEGHSRLFQVDLSRPLAPGSQEDILLRSGDRLTVLPRGRTVRVGGEVARPGLVGFHPGLAPGDYINLAGGFGSRAQKDGVRVIRAGDGLSMPQSAAGNLAPGDFVWVPEKQPGTPAWSLFKETLSVALQVATFYFIVKK
ncbi:MAG: SLBB domain-containing protein [Candidatus Eisenbacteria bacterium]|nr:SLBB domain-containing protein [Candidatus Eisenbacteria bacterium]